VVQFNAGDFGVLGDAFEPPVETFNPVESWGAPIQNVETPSLKRYSFELVTFISKGFLYYRLV